jgi:hypothetical protein
VLPVAGVGDVVMLVLATSKTTTVALRLHIRGGHVAVGSPPASLPVCSGLHDRLRGGPAAGGRLPGGHGGGVPSLVVGGGDVIRKKLGYPDDPMDFTPIDPKFFGPT